MGKITHIRRGVEVNIGSVTSLLFLVVSNIYSINVSVYLTRLPFKAKAQMASGQEHYSGSPRESKIFPSMHNLPS